MFEKEVKGVREKTRKGGRNCTGSELRANGDGGGGGGGGGDGGGGDRKRQGCGREEMADDACSGDGNGGDTDRVDG